MLSTKAELFPASLLHPGDQYSDLDNVGTLHHVATTERSTNGWYVKVTRRDGSERAYYINELVWIIP